jgi:hypothetical protein
VLSEFKRAVEARAIDMFWDSRGKGRLRSRPEKIAQGLLAVFAKGVVGNRGLVLREIASGVGFVDVGISFGGVLHLVELKILRTQPMGVSQLETYMRTEDRSKGWLMFFDTRISFSRAAVPPRINTSAGLIHTITVDINPAAPCSMRNRTRATRALR